MANIIRITRAQETALKKTIKPYVYDIKDQNTKTATIIIRTHSTERASVKKEIEKNLKSAKIKFIATRGASSVGITEVDYDGYKVKIMYKPISGGMNETTLNSTITELAPALAFMANKKFDNVKAMYEFLVATLTKANQYGVYVDNKDQKAGQDFIKTMPSSSKFDEKMGNAIGILKYLNELNSEQSISQVYWGYRKKPTGVDSNHKGDLFVKFSNGEMLGVSLKAGGEKTAEPQLNTYVNKLYDDFNRTNDKSALKTKIYNNIHKKIGLNSNWMEPAYKKESINKIEDFRIKNPKEYEKVYDKMLEIVRDAVIETVNKNKKDTIKYIKKQVIKKDENVPLVVVKAHGTMYKMVTDEDAIEVFLPTVTSIVASKSNSSKQEWYIDLKNKSDTIRMKMTIRTNKVPPENKIAQGFNLAIKFNGIA
jgi:tRNA(Leu) C34 or U34 (ribose-2'-O)-methylase TrmL